MDESRWTPKAVILAAVLHLGIVGFLFLAILPCSTYESLFAAIGLPASWNPISCEKPIQLAGEVIDATLVGVTGSPPPKTAQTKPVPHVEPPPPSTPPPPPPPVQQPPPKPSPLPPPPEHVDVKDQEKVVEEAAEKAAEAKQLQEEKERQRQSEIDAQAAAKQKKIDDLLAKMDAASKQTKQASSKAAQAKQQMEDLKDAQQNAQADLPKADQLQSGQNGPDAGLKAQYIAAIQNAVTPNWVHPDNMPSVSCKVNIVQSPGGDVMTANVDPSCVYDEAGKRSIENAVLRTKTLPYKGFESVFSRNITLTFKP